MLRNELSGSRLLALRPCTAAVLPVVPCLQGSYLQHASPHQRRGPRASSEQQCGALATPSAAATITAPPVKARPSADQVDIHRRAKACQLSGRVEQALSILHAGLQQFPHDTHLLSLAASLETRRGRLSKARALIQTGLAHSPRHVALLTAGALLEARTGQHEQARQLFQRALSRNPQNPALLQAWGNMEASAGNMRAARERFQAAVQLAPGMPHTYTAWARLEASCGDYARARQLFRQGADATQGHAPLLHAWAKLELDLGNSPIARKLLEQALRSNPTHAPSFMALGQVDWITGNAARARQTWQAGVDALGGACAPLLCYWAQREARIHNFKRARELLQAARQADPTHAHSAVLLASLEDRSGDGAKSDALYVDASKLMARSPASGVHAGDDQRQGYESTPAPSSSSSSNGISGPAQKQRGRRTGSPSPTAFQAQSPPAHTPTDATSTTPTPPSQSQTQPHTPSSQPSASPSSLSSQALEPSSIPLLQSLARHQLRRGMRDAALQALAQIEALEPCNGRMCHIRGILSQQEGAMAEAKEWFIRGTRCVDLEGCLLCWEGLAELLSFQGQTDAARRTFQAGAAAAMHMAYASKAAAPSPQQAAPQPATPRVMPAPVLASTTLSPATNQTGSGATAYTPTSNASSPSYAAPSSTQAGSTSSGIGAGGPSATAGGPLGDVQLHIGLTSRYLRQWAMLEKKAGHLEAAEPLFRAAARRDPQDYKTWLAWAVFERRRGRYEAAEKAFAQGVATAPNNPHMWYAYGSMVWKVKRDMAAARALFEQATRNCPRAAPLWMEWALMEWQGCGDTDAARALFQQGASVPPAYQHAPLFEAWAQLEQEAGDASRVRQLLDTAEGLALRVRAAKK